MYYEQSEEVVRYTGEVVILDNIDYCRFILLFNSWMVKYKGFSEWEVIVGLGNMAKIFYPDIGNLISRSLIIS